MFTYSYYLKTRYGDYFKVSKHRFYSVIRSLRLDGSVRFEFSMINKFDKPVYFTYLCNDILGKRFEVGYYEKKRKTLFNRNTNN